MAVPANVSELGTHLSERCFAYPANPSRLHGPRGYSHYEAYRDWLRDEFCFRCAYCLMREAWLRGPRGFQIDHCISHVEDPSRLLDYDNLVYTCPWCNQAKAGVSVPNPAEVGYGQALRVNAEGIIEAGNKLCSILLEGLKLDHPDITQQRRLVLRIVRLAEEKNNVAILLRLLGYPDDLPNLKPKRPPDGNSRPAGVHHSSYGKRRRGELAPIY